MDTQKITEQELHKIATTLAKGVAVIAETLRQIETEKVKQAPEHNIDPFDVALSTWVTLRIIVDLLHFSASQVSVVFDTGEEFTPTNAEQYLQYAQIELESVSGSSMQELLEQHHYPPVARESGE